MSQCSWPHLPGRRCAACGTEPVALLEDGDITIPESSVTPPDGSVTVVYGSVTKQQRYRLKNADKTRADTKERVRKLRAKG